MAIDLATISPESVQFYQNSRRARARLVPAPQPLNLVLYVPASRKRNRLERFIYNLYLRKHRADIRHFMPYLISLETMDMQIVAAAGFRPAKSGKLFLENYLHKPVEVIINEKLETVVARKSIVEVGNLASDGTHSSRLMIMAMTALFNQHGFEWVTMTGTIELANIFKRMNLVPVELCRAEAGRLGKEKNDWGSYYEHDPKVMTGSIRSSHEQMMNTQSYRRFLNSLRIVNFDNVGIAKSLS